MRSPRWSISVYGQPQAAGGDCGLLSQARAKKAETAPKLIRLGPEGIGEVGLVEWI